MVSQRSRKRWSRMSIRVRHYIRGGAFAVLALALMLNLYLGYTVTMAMVALAVVAVGDFVIAVRGHEPR